MKRWSLMAALLLVLCISIGCAAPRPWVVESFGMDTYLSLTVYRQADQAAAEQCLRLLDEFDRSWSAYREGSAIHTLNATGSAVIDDTTKALIEQAVAMAGATEGAFDPTIWPVSQLWHLSTRTEQEALPSEQVLAQAAALVDSGRVTLVHQGEQTLVSVAPGMGLDLGGIAKGFASDRIKQQLQVQGVSDAIINLGGNVCLLGEKERSVGIAHPRAQGILIKLRCRNTNVVTSGDYQRYVEVDGVRIHHLFDPKTGQVVNNGLCSVTIIGPSGAQCDTLSTAVFVLGREKGLALVKQLGLEAILIDVDKQVTVTHGLADKVTLMDNAYRLMVQDE